VILGLEVCGGTVIAVAADERGGVISRTKQDGVGASAAADAVRAVSGPGCTAIGLAVRDARDASFSEAITAAAGAAGAPGSPCIVTRGAAVALAEQWAGAARGARHVVALSVSDCVHAGIVFDGRPFEGAHGFAGAAGWLALNPVERDDYRKIGCLEAEIGGNGIVRRLVWRLKAGDDSRVLEMAGGDMSAITVQQIFDAARAGDGVAISVVRDTARYIGMAIGNLVSIVDPDVVILGGLMATAADLLLEPARTEAMKRMPMPVAGTVQITPAALGDDGAALGAARAAMLAT
jgi:glucokinase